MLPLIRMIVPGFRVVNVLAMMKAAMNAIRARMERLGLGFGLSPILIALTHSYSLRSRLKTIEISIIYQSI